MVAGGGLAAVEVGEETRRQTPQARALQHLVAAKTMAERSAHREPPLDEGARSIMGMVEVAYQEHIDIVGMVEVTYREHIEGGDKQDGQLVA